MPESRAIAMAIGIVKNWASGQGKVDANTRAAAAKAVVEWEAMKGRNAAKGAARAVVQHSAPAPSLADWRALEEQAILRVAVLEQQLGIDALVWLAESSNTGMLGAGAASGGGGGSMGSMGAAGVKMSSVGSQHGLGGGKTLDGSRTAGSSGGGVGSGGATVDGSKRSGGSGGGYGGGYGGYVQHSAGGAPVGVLLEAEAFSPELKRTASANGELERHEVHDSGQHVGTLCARSGMGAGSSTRWEARAINGERVTDYGNTSKPKALEALRKHLEEAPARVGRHGNGKYLVARPASYSGQDQYLSYPTEAAARYAAGLPEQPSSPEKASQVQQLGEVLCFDLMTLSGVDIPPLRRVQDARRRV